MDPVFAEITKILYGDALDPREAWDAVNKMMPDASALHSNNATERRRKKIAAGLLLGTAAESAATARAGQAAFTSPEKLAAKQALKATKKTSRIHLGPKAEFGLQAVNLGVGLAAARELMKPAPSQKKPMVSRAKPVTVSKRTKTVVLSDPHAQAVFRNNLKAAKHGKAALIGAAAVGGAVGMEHASRKYGIRPIHFGVAVPPAASKAVTNGVQSMKTAGSKANYKLKATGNNIKQKVQKSEADFTWEGTISKVDEDKRLVFGWCSLSKINGDPVVDLQGDYIPIEETENSAYRYVIESRKGGDMHRRVSKFNQDEPLHTADLVESMVFTPEKLVKMGLPPDALPHGWWIGMKVNDEEQWQNVKAGKRLGFSIHGKGRRVEKALDGGA